MTLPTTPTTTATGAVLVYIHGEAMRDPVLAIEAEARAAERASLAPILVWALGYLEVNDEPCRFDHRGGCQAHGYLDLEPGEECPEGKARRAVALLTEDPR